MWVVVLYECWMLDVGDGVCLARESRLATGVGRVG